MRPMPRALLLTAVLPAAVSAGDRSDGPPFATRSVVHARHGMVAAAHPLAVQIGVDVLQKGGSAVDAAIAVNAALGFLEPVSCGIGGDLFALVWDVRTGRLHGLNASGRAPRAASADKVPPDEDGTIPSRSPWAWTVPGAVDGWFELHAKFGRLPLADVLGPAIKAAREGEPVPQVIAGQWESGARILKDKPGFAATFLPDGRPPREGEIFRNPGLARAYEALVKGGRDAYYRGEIARAIVEMSQKTGGLFTLDDFTAHRSEWVEPLSTDYRGVRVFELPPNGQGITALMLLNILENFDLRAMGRDSADFWHTMVEAKKLAYEDRARFIADPAFHPTSVDWLLSKGYARERARQIDRARAAERIDAGHPPVASGDTTYLAVADGDGNMVSLIQSNYSGFGSGYTVDGWGFGLHNRGAQFSLKPGQPNTLQGGKRPFHTIIPAFAMKDGKPWLAFGVMGGDMQPQGHVQVLVNAIDFGMDLQEAGDAARYYHTGSSEPTGTLMTTGGSLALESGVPAEVRRELVKRGHQVTDRVGLFGGYQAVARDPATGVLSGATESRKDGCAMGY
jgi:gamma-glutamyltranspeptidase/glutathione hydrolase